MHAEADERLQRVDRAVLEIPLSSPTARRFLNSGRSIELYLYPSGGLLEGTVPTATPTCFRGRVKRSESDAPCDWEASDLHAPRIVAASGSVPSPAARIELELSGPADVPVFHAAAHKPLLRLRAALTQAAEQTDASPRHELRAHSTIRLPNPAIYTRDVREELLLAVQGQPFCEGTAACDLELKRADKRYLLSRFVYLVQHQYHRDRVPDVRQQKTLFDDV